MTIFKIKENHKGKSIDIYGKYGKYVFSFFGVLWYQLNPDTPESVWMKEAKEAHEISKIARNVFGPTSPYPIACAYLENVFEKGDEGFYDGEEFIHPITSQQIKEFISICEGRKTTYQHIIKKRIVIHSVNNPNDIINLFKKYQPEHYEHYNPCNIKNVALRGLTKKSEPDRSGDDYIFANKTIDWIEEHPEQILHPYEQGIWKRQAYWRIM